MSGQRYSVTIDVGANISSAKSAALLLKGIFDNIGLGAGQSSKISNMFSELDKALDEVQRKSTTALTSMGEVKGLDKAKDRVTSLVNAINSEFTKMGKMGNVDLAKNFGDLTRKINDATKAIRNYNTTISGISKGHAAAKSSASALSLQLAELTKYYEQLKLIRKEFGKEQKDEDILKALNLKLITAKGLDTRRRNELLAFYDAHGGKESVLTLKGTIRQEWAKNNAQDALALEKLILASDLASLAFTLASEKYLNFSNALSNFKGSKAFEELKKNAAEATLALQKFDSGVLNAEAFNKLKAALELAFPGITAGIQNSATAVDEFKQRIELISTGKLEEFRKKVPEIDTLLKLLGVSSEEVGKKVTDGMSSFSAMREADADIEHLTYRLKYFFSLAGGFNLMRRAIRSAVTTTKELDAAMTLTAVVSTYTVSDMWKTLPKYSKEASKLGTAIKDVYNALTLYVQLGLDMNTAMNIGVETMKMARVAGIGAEEATNSMTAALRGFNMAIDEKSALRINDVYSKLAQNTASNTQEISTAMTKTAALANSANMSFENTAAFLATIIESTREGAETAGTALKTVIARFTEVKLLYTKNQLMGTDEEGQEIDVNKISKALRTAGINMNEFFTGAKGLDEIFKELGSKWNNLSTVQQRYIATLAAGSRQQSRFLALMQNYERTVELTEMAYNSAGSGQEQFEKTLDSLEAKMELLKNSWDTLLMGLANSDAIKGVVDFGTSILDIINKIISAISGSSGLTKALATLSLGMGVFKIGRGTFGKGGLLGSLLGGKEISTKVSRTLIGGITTSLRRSETTRELGNALDGTITNSLKRSFRFWGKGTEIEGQYFSSNLLDNIKKEAVDYLKARESIQEDINKKLLSFDEAQANASLRALTDKEAADLLAREKALEDAKKLQEALDKKYYETLQKNGLNLQLAVAAALSPSGIPEATVNYKALANAALLAGVAITAVGKALKDSGKAGAETAEAITAVGTGLITAATAAKLLLSIGTAIKGLSFLSGGIGAGIAAGLGAIVAIVGVIDALTESAEERLKRINESISENLTHIKTLENEYKQVDDSLGSIIEKQDNLNKLTEGTIAWKDAVKELNTEIQTLVLNFPDFLEAVKIGDNGEWTIDIDKVKLIQQEKKVQTNEKRQLDAALLYNKLLGKISEIETNNEFYNSKYVADLTAKEGNLYTKLEEILVEGNYSKISLASIDKLSQYLENHDIGTYGEIVNENSEFKWLADFLSANLVKKLLDEGNYFGAFLPTFVSGLSLYKLRSTVTLLILTELNSFMTLYLMDLLDEALPIEIYGGTFRKFIYDKAKERASKFKIKKINSEDLAFYGSEYNRVLEAENIDREPTDSEIEAYAAIVKLKESIEKDYLDYFEQNRNNFTLGKLTLGQYKNKLDNSAFGDIEYLISKYYIDLFDSFELLLKEIGNNLNFDDNITANVVSQVESVVRDVKNNYGKLAALDVSLFIQELYSSLLDENGLLKTNIFNGAISDLESGKITTLDLLELAIGTRLGENNNFNLIRDYFTKPKSILDWIDNFSDELSFLGTLRSKLTSTFTEEEKDKLLKTGFYKADLFNLVGQEWELLEYAVDTIADNYNTYLENMLLASYDLITISLRNKQAFDKRREELTSDDKKLVDFLALNFNNIADDLIRKILEETFKIKNLYNPNTGAFVDLDNIDTDALKSIYLPWLFESDEYNLQNLQAILGNFIETLGNAKNQLVPETYSKLNNYILGIMKVRGTKRGNSLMSQLLEWNEGNVFEDIDSINKFPEFLDAIEKLDWSNIDDIEDFLKALDDLGIALNNASGQLEDLFKVFELIYKLSKIVTVDDIKSLTLYGLLLKDEIKNKTDASYTKELRDYLVNAQKDLIDLFIYNAETGAYTYIGNKLDLEKVALRAAVTTGYDLLAALYIVALGPTANGYKEALATLGLTEEDIDEILSYLDDIDFIRLLHYAALELKLYAGLNNDQARMAGASAGVQKATTITDAEKAGLNINELTNYALLLSQVNTTLLDTTGNANELAYAIAYDNMLMNKGISELSSNYSSWGKILEKAAEDEKVKSTADYANAIVGLRGALLKITGTTVEFSEEFLTAKENLDLFKKAAKGDTDAINLLRKSAAKNILDVNSLGAAGQLLSNWLDGLDLDSIKIGAELDTNVADVFLGLLDAGIMTADLVNLALEAIGWLPDVGTETVTVGSGTLTHQNGYTTFTDVNGVTHKVKNEGGMDIAADLQIEVPVIGGSSKAKAMGSGRKAAKFKGGAGSTANPPPKSGGGGGGKKDFKNDFDKYYNQVEDINELIRQRNLLESDYNQLLKAEGTSGADIYKNLKKQLGLLEERRKLTADLADKRKQLLFETMAADEYKDVAKYAKWNEEDQTIEIDWEAINKIKDSEEGNLVKEYIKKLEEFLSKYDEQVQALEEIEDLVQEIKERGKEQYLSLENRVRDALIKLIQDKIDELTEVDRAINDTNQKLFDSISQTLELQRQERTNAETEEDLTDKEKRLAYLLQDSSNANAVEIALLQEELADARQDYTDSLIDLKISELQRLNEEAQELRLQLIELMQQSLDWQEKSGAFWDEVYRLISEGTDATGALLNESELKTLLQTEENWDGLSAVGQMEWLTKLQEDVASALAYLEMNRLLEDIGTKEGTQVTFKNGKGETLTGTVDKEGNVVVKNADGSTTTYKDVFLDYHGVYRTFEEGGETLEPEKTPEETPEKTPDKKPGSGGKKKVPDNKGWYKDETKHWHQYTDGTKYDEAAHSFLDMPDSSIKVCKICGYVKKVNTYNTGGDNGGSGTAGRTPNKETKRYATGGLNTRSGVAWLDGTANAPELVLNARDTENFIELKDTLASIKSNGGLNLTGGDNYYDIKVQVDSLGSDYDVDKAIDRIKTRIAQENAYRNVNALSRLR